MQSEAAQNKA